MFDFDDEEEQVDQEAVARQAAEELRDADWKVRFGACRVLDSVGAAAAPHAKILARVAAKDKEADVRKAAQGVLNALRTSGVTLPADYLDDYADEDEVDRARELKKKQREEAWAERRKQREKEWEEKEKVLKEQERLEEERRRREDQLLYQQYENCYAEEPSPAPSTTGDAADGASSFSTVASTVPEAPRRPGKTRQSAFSSFRPSASSSKAVPPPFDHRPCHPAYATPQEDQDFELMPEDDFEEREAQERAEREKELLQKQEQAEERRRQKAEASERVPDEVPWDGFRANFRILSEILTMRLEHEQMTPQDVAEVWEKRWGIPYATHVKFEAPGTERKFMRPRDDIVPLHPCVVTLHDKAGSVLHSLAPALREYGGLLPEEAEALRLSKLQRSLATAERRQKANARDRERIHVKETRARLKAGTFQERQDKRVQEMRGVVNQALGIVPEPDAPGGRPQRLMRELKRSSLPQA